MNFLNAVRPTLLVLILVVASSCSTKMCQPEDVKKSNGPSSLTQLGQNVKKVKVYKPDGSIQCEPKSGKSIEESKAELVGVTIISSEKKHDGLLRAQVCGTPTGQCHVFEINEADEEKALKLGFKIWKGE